MVGGVVETRRLGTSYGRTVALRDLDLSLAAGEVLGRVAGRVAC